MGCAIVDFFNDVREYEAHNNYDISLYVEKGNYDNIRNILEKNGHSSIEFSRGLWDGEVPPCDSTHVPFCEETRGSKRRIRFRWYGKVLGFITRCHINLTIHEMDNRSNDIKTMIGRYHRYKKELQEKTSSKEKEK